MDASTVRLFRSCPIPRFGFNKSASHVISFEVSWWNLWKNYDDVHR
jgi:hypothetical protein